MGQRTIRSIAIVGLAMLMVLLSVACAGSSPAEGSLPPPATAPASPADTAAAASPTVAPERGEATGLRPPPEQSTSTGQPEVEEEMATPTLAEGTRLPVKSAAEKMVTAAKEELARQLGLAQEEIRAVSVEAVQWPDASLGCPQPGMMYAQVITPGFRVVLEVEGRTYEVHTDTGRRAVLCEEGTMSNRPSAPGTVEPGLERLIGQAKEDLAQRLSIEVDGIEVLEAKAVVWPDASLGCPLPGMRYKQVPMDGALIRLQAEGKVYEYHSGGGRDPFLCEQPLKLQKDAPPQLDLFKLTPGSPSD